MNKILELLKHADPKWIERHFPTQEWAYKHESYKACFQALMQRASAGLVTPELATELESLGEKFREIYQYLEPKTELSDKARLNEVVMWMESQCLERGIYLAGLAKEKKVKEPYYTQLMILPAHACLQRYRQSYQVEEWIRLRVQSIPNGNVADVLASWKSSFLAQLSYFATDAFNHNPSHNHARYHKVMSLLLTGQALEEQDKSSTAQSLYNMANQIMNDWIEPTDGYHFMQATYLKRSLDEFKSFRRLSAKHPVVLSRLSHLVQAVSAVSVIKPSEFYTITPYLITATRAASIVGAAATTVYSFGIDVNVVRDAIDDLWSWATNIAFNDSTSSEMLQAVIDTGGMANTFVIDSGGMANKFLADAGGMAATMESVDFMSYMV
jgi:hypothetical protein